MSDKLEMPLEQFAEAVTKENVRLNQHNEKLKGQTNLYFDAFNKAIARIKELEAALRACHSALNVAFEYDGNVFGFAHNDAVDADILASKALEGKDE